VPNSAVGHEARRGERRIGGRRVVVGCFRLCRALREATVSAKSIYKVDEVIVTDGQTIVGGLQPGAILALGDFNELGDRSRVRIVQ
jgi:hypothetical protein